MTRESAAVYKRAVMFTQRMHGSSTERNFLPRDANEIDFFKPAVGCESSHRAMLDGTQWVINSSIVPLFVACNQLK